VVVGILAAFLAVLGAFLAVSGSNDREWQPVRVSGVPRATDTCLSQDVTIGHVRDSVLTTCRGLLTGCRG
jgi:hypothetical protein